MDKKLSFYFIFSFFLLPFKIFGKSVDRWTSSEHSEKKSPPCMLLFKSVYLQTRSCLSISCFLSALHPSKSCQKVWTSLQVMKMLKICLFALGFHSLRCYFAWPTYWYLGKSQWSQATPLGWLCTGALTCKCMKALEHLICFEILPLCLWWTQQRWIVKVRDPRRDVYIQFFIKRKPRFGPGRSLGST